jgi:hypothetical protein
LCCRLTVELWNLVDTYNPDVVTDTKCWLKEDIGNAEIFGAYFKTYRRDRSAFDGRVFMCVKNFIASTELSVDDDFDMIAFEVKVVDRKYTYEIIGIFRYLHIQMRICWRLNDWLPVNYLREI